MENNKGSVSDVIDATGELAASVVGLFLKINPDYKIEYLDGGTSFGMINPTDDIMVAYL